MNDTTESLEDLARYVVGRPWWRWMAGMRVREFGGYVFGEAHDGEWCPKCDDHWCGCPGHIRWWFRDDEGNKMVGEPDTPDLSDPATVGCLLALAEELAGGPVDLYVSIVQGERWSSACAFCIDVEGEGPTRAVAIVRLCDALSQHEEDDDE